MNRWKSRPAPDALEGLILFDGVCLLCSRWVRFVIDRDPAARFRFLSIQSPKGRSLAAEMGISPDDPETNVVVLHGRAWFKSDAALMVLGALPSTRAIAVLRWAPRWLRNPAYDLIARNRYRLFGRSATCMTPSASDRARFVS